MSETKQDSLDEALAIVDVAYDGSELNPPQIVGWPAFGRLVPLNEDERKQLESLRDLVRRFVLQKSYARPLSIAVFGPPGSGKSFAVKQIGNEALKGTGHTLSLTTINLTQLASLTELSTAVATALLGAAREAVSFLFFDEFDTVRDGAPYGWLSWFLAPMHDGQFIHSGKVIPVTQAVFVFAGGTATTLADFSSRDVDATFRNAKGPDFVSRLRGFLDVAGPNSPPQMLRRAIVLRSELQKCVQRHGRGSKRVRTELLKAMLQVGRYRHGARSIAALMELSELSSDLMDWNILPEDHLVEMQVDRGPLDSKAIGGSIALSGFSSPSDLDAKVLGEESMEVAWSRAIRALLNEGATLAYAGRWKNGAVQLTKLLKDELSTRPPELSADEQVRAAPRPRFLSFLDSFNLEEAKRSVDCEISERERIRIGIALVVPAALAIDEAEWGAADWRARIVERFRRRLAVTESSVARFIIGGKRVHIDSWCSGIVEEAILSLALGQPIYVAGGFGGAAADLGVVLGLARLRTGAVPDSMRDQLTPAKRRQLDEIKERLRPPPLTNLPVSADEQISFLHDHALGGSGWPNNGLTSEQNRQLFETQNPAEVERLLIAGLLRRLVDYYSPLEERRSPK